MNNKADLIQDVVRLRSKVAEGVDHGASGNLRRLGDDDTAQVVPVEEEEEVVEGAARRRG